MLYAELEWQHAPFLLQTEPIQHSLCGSFTYSTSFMGVDRVLTPLSIPMSYDSDSMTFKIYSELLDLIGDHQLTLSAHLTDYPSIATEKFAEKTVITIVDPCIDP